MSSAWHTISIKDLGRVVTGRTPSSSNPEHFGGSYPFITPSDISLDNRHIETERYVSEEGKESLERILLPKGAVCFVCIGATIGKICVTSRPSFTNQQINSVVVDESKHDSRFAFYALSLQGGNAKALAGGAATPIINKSAFSDIEIEVPDLPTQRKIAGILSAYDDLIENNLRRIKILEEMAQSLYREWFVHFRFPGHESATFKDSELGRIPEGWNVSEFREIFDIRYGKTLPKTEIVEVGPYPVYGAGSVIGYYHKAICLEKCALVTSRGNGSGTVWRTREPAFVTNNSLIILPRPKYGQWKYPFVEMLLKSSNVMSAKTGSAQPQVTIENLNYVEAIVPSESIAVRFCDLVTPIYEQVDCLFNKCKNLRRTRDLLLPSLLNSNTPYE